MLSYWTIVRSRGASEVGNHINLAGARHKVEGHLHDERHSGTEH